ncbi:7-dehydrocholesterol reductase [Dendrobium catenatum]|uniref:7-dehydrocholesterol reductase n=1 Tax=Dendrobium catenatum TaxID=906689 RepID=A0A2I0VKH3_9ASPA|nr:7-dehydrocholesterol reductase [Dendrobium catenatum]
MASFFQGHVAPSSTDSGSSGNPIVDFYWGMELYPRIGKDFDIKVFTNCRFGMMSWAVLAMTYCFKQESYGEELISLMEMAAAQPEYFSNNTIMH